MDTSKVTRIEVIDHTRDNGGRVYTYWDQYDADDLKNPKVEISIQDNGRTLKVFISKNEDNKETGLGVGI